MSEIHFLIEAGVELTYWNSLKRDNTLQLATYLQAKHLYRVSYVDMYIASQVVSYCNCSRSVCHVFYFFLFLYMSVQLWCILYSKYMYVNFAVHVTQFHVHMYIPYNTYTHKAVLDVTKNLHK